MKYNFKDKMENPALGYLISKDLTAGWVFHYTTKPLKMSYSLLVCPLTQ